MKRLRELSLDYDSLEEDDMDREPNPQLESENGEEDKDDNLHMVPITTKNEDGHFKQIITRPKIEFKGGDKIKHFRLVLPMSLFSFVKENNMPKNTTFDLLSSVLEVEDLGNKVMDLLKDYMIISLLFVCKRVKNIMIKLTEKRCKLSESLNHMVQSPFDMFGSIIIDNNINYISWFLDYFKIVKTLRIGYNYISKDLVNFINQNKKFNPTNEIFMDHEDYTSKIPRTPFREIIELPIIFLIFGDSNILEWYNSKVWLEEILSKYNAYKIALGFGNIEVIKWLKKKRIRPHSKTETEKILLKTALLSGHKHSIDWYISEYGPIDFNFDTIFSDPLINGLTDMCDYLLQLFKSDVIDPIYPTIVPSCVKLCNRCIESAQYSGVSWLLRNFPEHYFEILDNCKISATKDFGNEMFFDWLLRENILKKADVNRHLNEFSLKPNLVKILIKCKIRLPNDYHLNALKTGDKILIRELFQVNPLSNFDKGFQKRMGPKLWKMAIKDCTDRKDGTYGRIVKIRKSIFSLLKNFNVYADETIIEKSTSYESIPLMDYLISNLNLPWDESTLIRAIDCEYTDIALWAISKGCPMTMEVTAMAHFSGNQMVFQQLILSKCPWDHRLILLLRTMQIYWNQSSSPKFETENDGQEEKQDEYLEKQSLLNFLNEKGKKYIKLDSNSKIQIHKGIIHSLYTGKVTVFQGFRRMKSSEILGLLDHLYGNL